MAEPALKFMDGSGFTSTGEAVAAPAIPIADLKIEPQKSVPATSLSDSITSGDISGLLKQNQSIFQEQLKAFDLSPEYLSLKRQFGDTQNQLRGLQTNYIQNQVGIENKPIPMDEIGNELTRLQKNVAFREIPLTNQLQAITGQLNVLQEERNQTLAKLQLMAEQGRYDTSLAMQFNEIRRAEQKEAKALAREYGITSQFYVEGGTVYRTSDGKPYSSKDEFFNDPFVREQGITSFNQARQTGLLSDIGESLAMRFQREQYERSIFEGDRAFGFQQQQFNRGVFESDRAYQLQSQSLIENEDGSRSIVNLLDGSTRKVSGDSYWDLYGGITGMGSPLWKNGVDADLKTGDPVFSIGGGEVIAVASDFVGPVKGGGFGNQVKVRLDSGEEVWYSHLKEGTVQKGQRVEAGQVIGIGGNTGDVIAGKGGDGSHLDLTIKTADGKYMTEQQAFEFANQVYKQGSSTIALTKDQKQILQVAGLNDATINNILRDINAVGVEEAMRDSGLSPAQIQAVYTAFGQEKSSQFLSKDYFKNIYTEAQLKASAKEAGFTAGGFLGIGVGQKGIDDYLNYLEGLVNQYRQAGYSDQEILKMMQK